ncbi:hypothetical protein [Archangium violaceum]|uniref:Double-GTPase 1 domain-containing protein n=1 Tax=Archangium violaceum Cb vi76 TaxID=1406225 RepID=A0A084SX20_9BACT|nr:hypothetical protein [Archangium violaceum]KFA93005.1 hypothetical protein Q664_12040 [Archangium violaceum Cb vi76]
MSRNIALLGAQFSGKSTFLGALGNALKAKALKHLHMAGLDADARALQRLAEPLHHGRYPQRTKAGERQELVVPLRTEGGPFGSDAFTLRAGDYDGEEVDRLFRDRLREWTSEWQQRALAHGFLLLIRPGDIRPPRLHSHPMPDDMTRWRQLREPGASSASAPVTAQQHRSADYFGRIHLEEAPPPPYATASDPVSIPAELPLIELLQFIRNVRELPPGRRPRKDGERFRIALLVTAWDAIPPEWRKAGPAAFLSHHFPLLEDYLWSNFLPDDVFRFGLSATGGDLKDTTYSETYMDDPSGFVEWLDPAQGILNSRDMGLPLYWALYGDRAFAAL